VLLILNVILSSKDLTGKIARLEVYLFHYRISKMNEVEVPLEKVYGRGAFEPSLKEHNRLN